LLSKCIFIEIFYLFLEEIRTYEVDEDAEAQDSSQDLKIIIDVYINGIKS